MFKTVKELLAARKAASQWNQIRSEVDAMDAKHLLTSKTFWVNVAGLALTIGGILPQKWAVPVMAGGNIIMRLLSNQPVWLFSEPIKPVKEKS